MRELERSSKEDDTAMWKSLTKHQPCSRSFESVGPFHWLPSTRGRETSYFCSAEGGRRARRSRDGAERPHPKALLPWTFSGLANGGMHNGNIVPYAELCKNSPDTFCQSPSKCFSAHPKIALLHNISASHSRNLAEMFTTL